MKLRRLFTITALSASLMGCATEKNTAHRPWNYGITSLDWEGYQKVYVPFLKASKLQYISPTEEKDYWQTPAETEKLRSGVCRDFAIYLNQLWKAEGLDGQLVVGHFQASKTNQWHAWNRVVWGGEKYIVDSTNKVFIKEKDKAPGVYIERDYPLHKCGFVPMVLREMNLGVPSLNIR